MKRWVWGIVLLLCAGVVRAQEARFEVAVACIKRYDYDK